ncbi:F-actin-capping protein subunit alpha-like [Gossypium australe]|uniref:F-actin-capping protein subunit alpha n=1 Tax=Gossypium australe TaxID=47621 RepID=A0A5B6VUN7_9ROSI|nr:F-actin-capping protein subunit alpha-like [Gossypium australe]
MTKRLITPQSEKVFFFLNACLLLESSLNSLFHKQASPLPDHLSLSYFPFEHFICLFFFSLRSLLFCRSRKKVMAEEGTELSDKQKKEIAKWFLLNAPAGEIQYVAKDLKSVLNNDDVYDEAASEAFPVYNKSHMICLEMPGRFGDVLVTSYGELQGNEYLDPKTAQVAIVDHVKQVCTEVRPATDEELPTPYVEEYRCALEAELLKYVGEAYPKGSCSVYCINGKDVEGPGYDFELVAVISAARLSPQNFCTGSWRSIWNIECKDDIQVLELKGKLQVGAHYFEEGNVQLDAKHECRDSTMFQSPDDSAIAIASLIRHHETEYLASLEVVFNVWLISIPCASYRYLLTVEA